MAAFSLVAVFWFLAASYNIAIWPERVETKRNIAELPTRGVTIPSPVRGQGTIPRIHEALSLYNQHIAINAPTMGELEFIESPFPPTE